MTDADVLMGRVVARRYLIGRVLGFGTMGTVRAAHDLDLDQEVAIKLVNVDELSRDEAVERFRREVHAATRIKSEHVVRVLDVGSFSNGMPFMVMELLRGRGLDEERDLRGVIPVDEAVGYILPVIEVLAEMHAAGAVHRDIKPANLFLEERPPAPRFVKVLDFGVSKSALELASRENAITKTGAIMGSPLYMAPEQLRSSRSVDARADIWSLGAILFELVTGFTAHEGDSVAEICATLLRDPPRPITDFGSELPREFAGVVMRCLEPERERRYSNVAELGAALLRFAPSGAAHVERARRALGESAVERIDVGERAPSSDAPVALHIADGTRESGHFRNHAGNDLGGLRIARMAVAFTLIGLGIGTSFLIEFPRQDRPGPAARPARVTAPSLPAAVATAPDPSPRLVPSAQKPPFEPRPPLWKTTPKRKAVVEQPRTAASVGITDFGGRR